MPKLSIIVPVYNTQQYLEKCLHSLVNQTLEDIEILVVNDGSTDNSEAIIEEFAKKYPDKLHVYKKENGGLSSSRNYGIDKSLGEYIGFVDSDDYVALDMYEKMYDKAKKCDLDIVVCDTVKVYDDNEKEVMVHANLNYSYSFIKNYIISPPMAPSRIYKSGLFNRDVKFKEGTFYEDLHIVPTLVNFTDKIGFLEEGLYFYYQRSGSIMYQEKFNKNLLHIFSVLEYVGEQLNQYKDEVEYLYITHLLRTASLRFLDHKEGVIQLKEIKKIMKEKFPNWRKNIYYKKSSWKLKLICLCAYHDMIGVLHLLKKWSHK